MTPPQTPRFITVLVEEHDELPEGCCMRFKVVANPRAVRRVRYATEGAPMPHDDAGAYAGYTRNSTFWHIRWQEGGGSCSVTNVAVATYDSVTLPAWSPPPTAGDWCSWWARTRPWRRD